MKEITPTPELMALVNKVAGTDVNPASIAIFEAIANNTLPVNQRGSIYDRSTMTPQFLAQMAAFVKAGESVPMQTFHQLNREMPVGKVFDAQLVPSDGKNTELRILYYVVRAGNEKLISDTNAGAVDELSTGTRPGAALCSGPDCGFDYLGPEADIMNWLDQTCANGHVIGKDGVHLMLPALDRWLETSYVGAGAADHAKIVGRSRQLMARGGTEHQRLAASSTPQHAHAHTVLFASATHQEKPTMADTPAPGVAELTAQIVALSTQVGTLTVEKATLLASTTALTTERDALKASTVELQTKVDGAAAALKLQADHDVMLAFLKDQSLKAQTAAGVKEGDLKKLDKPADLIASLTENGKHLAQLLAAATTATAQAADAGTGGGKAETTLNAAASGSFRMAR